MNSACSRIRVVYDIEILVLSPLGLLVTSAALLMAYSAPAPAVASPCPSAGYSICISGSAHVTFAGPSTFALAGGIYQGASGMPSTPALSLGYGTTTNSFNIGKATDGNSLNEANGATLFGDASGTGDLFQMGGNLTTTGGTSVAVSAAAEHDINGYIPGAGGLCWIPAFIPPPSVKLPS